MLTILDGNYSAPRSVVALGMFDGVHIGHQVLIKRGAALAKQHGVPLVVCTFQEHPLHLIAPEKCPPLLSTFEERNLQMEKLGVDVLCAMPFTQAVMDMLPEEYVGQLVRRFHPTDVVCGYNHTFGRKGQGTPALLEALGAALGFGVSVVPKITLDGQDVSSTVIRGVLSRGDVQTAAHMLGRPYECRAVIEQRQGGTYTAVLRDRQKQALPDGAYRALCTDGSHIYPVVARWGKGGRVRFALPSTAVLADEVSFRLLTNLSIDF